jgi:hypothetical protein
MAGWVEGIANNRHSHLTLPLNKSPDIAQAKGEDSSRILKISKEYDISRDNMNKTPIACLF